MTFKRKQTSYTEPKLQDGLKWKRFLKHYTGNEPYTLGVAMFDRCPSRLQIERLIEIHGEHAADRPS